MDITGSINDDTLDGTETDDMRTIWGWRRMSSNLLRV